MEVRYQFGKRLSLIAGVDANAELYITIIRDANPRVVITLGNGPAELFAAF